MLARAVPCVPIIITIVIVACHLQEGGKTAVRDSIFYCSEFRFVSSRFVFVSSQAVSCTPLSNPRFQLVLAGSALDQGTQRT